MRKSIFLLFFSSLFLSVISNAQTLNTRKVPAPQKEKTFFEIQKEFNDYWAPYHVKNGYYIENGIKKKAPGWKQFKRWEYYWENRVNPTTGAFPKTTAADIYQKLKMQRNSRSSAGSWTSLGPSSSNGGYEGIGRINCVAFRPGDNNTYYAGAPSGGLWKTTDNGSTWTVLTDDNAVLGVSDAVVAAGTTPASDTIYIATGDRDGGSMWTLGSGNWNDNNSIGVLKSTDGGTTWNTTGLTYSASERKSIWRLLMDPTNHNILYAATSTGLYKTTDGGVNWTQISGYLLKDMEFKPGNTSIMYGGNTVGYIYRSTDGGQNWTTIVNEYSNNGRRVNLAVTEDDATVVYAIMSYYNGGLFGIYKSTDSGASYTKVYDGTAANQNLLGWKTDGSDSGGQGSYDLSIAVSPTNANTVYVGGVNSHKSTDGGATWKAVNCWTGSSTYNKISAPVVHADKHMLKFRSSDNTLFETNDGGIYYTTDGGISWTDKTNGMVPSQLYRLGVTSSNANEIIAGLQDNATKLLSGGSWSMVSGGDGMECIIDSVDNNTQYATTPRGNLKRTTNHWASSTNISVGTESGHWVTPYVIDPNNHQTLFIGLDNVWKSTNQGTSWTKLNTTSSLSKYRSIAVAPSNSQVIYAADNDSIWVTTNGGTSWSYITGTLPTVASSITYISVKNNDPATAWVSLGQYNADGVYETTDYGATWNNISTGLPEIPVMCVIQNKLNTAQKELYAATDVGVYLKLGNSNWVTFSSGLPNVVVNELEIYYNYSQPAFCKLRAATSGRGLWESDLYSSPTSPPVADFEADNTSVGVGQIVSFTDLSTNAPTSWNWSFTPSTIIYENSTTSTSPNPQVSFNNTGNYTVRLIATNAYGSDTMTKTDYISISTLLNYCTASGGGGEYISGVVLGSINNTGTAADGYHDYTNLQTNLQVGQNNTISITNGEAYVGDDTGGWIDWNHDGDFDDANENIVCDVDGGASGSYNFPTPNDAILGATTMRIRIKYGGSDCGSPCGTTTYGEVEDYRIDVTPGSATWLGNSTQWNDANNWSTGVIPTSSYNVTIPASPTGGLFPTVPSGYTAKCNILTVETNAIITVDGTLEVNQ